MKYAVLMIWILMLLTGVFLMIKGSIKYTKNSKLSLFLSLFKKNNRL